MAERLLEKDTISLPDIVEILGPRPFPLKASLLEYLEELKERDAEDILEAAKKADEESKETSEDDAAEVDEKVDEKKEDKKEEK